MNDIGSTYRCFLQFLIMGLLVIYSGLAEGQEVGDTNRYIPVIVDNADKAIAKNSSAGTVRYLSGNLRLRQDSTLFYGDSAVLREERMRAWGNIIIQRNDTSAVFADSLIYLIRKRKAILYENVSLKNGSRELFTDSLTYHLNSKKAHYDSWALLTDGKATMKSKRGTYDARAQTVLFQDSVQLKHPKFYLRSEQLLYKTNRKKAEFIAPTHIVQDSANIYTEDGYYSLEKREMALTKNALYRKGKVRSSADSMLVDIQGEVVHLVRNARYKNEKLEASGDYIRYNDRTGEAYVVGNAYIKTDQQEMRGKALRYNRTTGRLRTDGRSVVHDTTQIMAADKMDFSNEQKEGMATGAVQWKDTSEHIEIRTDTLMRRGEEELFAHGGRPLFLTKLEEDSMYISSDTLHRFVDEKDSTQQMAAYYDVRIFKDDLQAISDSLHYSASDSVFVLNGNPLMWTDTTQLRGDTIFVHIRNDRIDRVVLKQNALILSTTDYLFYNQIKGKKITAWFESGELNYVDVEGNAQAVYYLIDKKGGYVGVDETESSKIRISFQDQEIETIRFNSPKPKGKITPMKKADHRGMQLEGFEWLEDRRPRTIEDLMSRWIVLEKEDPFAVPVQ